ncbi:MAG: OmpA family protein, partial [Methylococcales bacterium]
SSVATSEIKKKSLSNKSNQNEPLPKKVSITSPEKKKVTQIKKSETTPIETGVSYLSEEDAFISSYMIFFDFDKSKLSQDALATLEDWYLKFKNHKLQIVGFTDNVGPRIHNKALATSRAYQVRKFFLDKGFNFRDLSIIGKELCCYLKPNLTEMQRAKNRRVEIRIID